MYRSANEVHFEGCYVHDAQGYESVDSTHEYVDCSMRPIKIY